MGKIKYLDKIEKFIIKTPVFEISSLKKIISLKNKKSRYTYLLVNNLVKKRKIKRVTRGFYTIHDDATLAVFCFKPAYLGLQDALSFHNLWEQETIPIIITTKKIRTGIRKILNENVLIRKINRKYFFGFSYAKYGSLYIPVSDIEKTLIDLVYFRQKIDKETAREIIRKIDRKKLKEHLKKFPKKFRKKFKIYLK